MRDYSGFTGGAWLPSEKVIAACDGYIANLDEHIAELLEERIQEIVDKPQSWFSRLLGKPPKTREDALAELKQRDLMYSEYELIKGRSYMRRKKCKQLIALAKEADQVFISGEMMYALRTFF